MADAVWKYIVGFVAGAFITYLVLQACRTTVIKYVEDEKGFTLIKDRV